MNWLRRLFGQQSGAIHPEEHLPAAPVDDSPTREAPRADAPATTITPPALVSSLPANGVTRPLPQEPSFFTTGDRHIAFGQMTDVGMVRTNNQDAAFSLFSTARSVEERPDFGLFVVADGMGGHHDGEKASALAARTFAREILNSLYLPLLAGKDEPNENPVSEVLVEAVLRANSAVLSRVPDGGTTLTAVIIIGDLAHIVHVGDSRVYLISRDGIDQVTRDHSLVQRLIELDQITAEEAADHPQKNVLYRALGQTENLEVDTLTRRLQPNTRILICSDGLWNQLAAGDLREAVLKHSDPQEACEQLIALANARGGLDNITAILLQMPG